MKILIGMMKKRIGMKSDVNHLPFSFSYFLARTCVWDFCWNTFLHTIRHKKVLKSCCFSDLRGDATWEI